jgi:hypothetical protein
MHKKTYRSVVNGKNFLVDFEGAVQKIGFFMCVIVTTEDDTKENEVEMLVVERIRSDEKLQKMTLNEMSDSPIINVESIEELSDNDKDITKKYGYMFYKEN